MFQHFWCNIETDWNFRQLQIRVTVSLSQICNVKKYVIKFVKVLIKMLILFNHAIKCAIVKSSFVRSKVLPLCRTISNCHVTYLRINANSNLTLKVMSRNIIWTFYENLYINKKSLIFVDHLKFVEN